MVVSSQARWEARRRLHEEWGAPLELVARAAGLSLPGLRDRAASQAWSGTERAAGVADLGAKLEASIAAELSTIRAGPGEGTDDRRARAIATLVKAWNDLRSERGAMGEGADGANDAAGTAGPGELAERRALLARMLAALPCAEPF